MDFEFDEEQASYDSGAQTARVWTERWVARWVYCPCCGNAEVRRFEANRPVADFHCQACAEEYELKSQRGVFGRKIVDGAYSTMRQRLAADNNPSLLLLNYDYARRIVTNLFVVPKYFFVPAIIEARPPLSSKARRAGWVGCKIVLARIPAAGRVYLVRDGRAVPKDAVLRQWQSTAFLREEKSDRRTWLIEVLRCVEEIPETEFTLQDMYSREAEFAALFPENRHVRDKIRQQLQLLRDRGMLEFLGRGRYRRIDMSADGSVP